MQQQVTQSILLTVRDVMREMGLSRSKVDQLIKREGLPAIHFGRAVRVYKKSLEQWIEEREKQRVLL